MLWKWKSWLWLLRLEKLSKSMLLPEFCFIKYLWQVVIKYWTRMFWLETGATKVPHHYVELVWCLFVRALLWYISFVRTCLVSSAISVLRVKKWTPEGWVVCSATVSVPCLSTSYTHPAHSVCFRASSLVWAMMKWRIHHISCHLISPWPYIERQGTWLTLPSI